MSWCPIPPLVILGIATLIAAFKGIPMTFLWLCIQIMQLFSLVMLFQVLMVSKLTEMVSWYSLIRVDIFRLRKLYDEVGEPY